MKAKARQWWAMDDLLLRAAQWWLWHQTLYDKEPGKRGSWKQYRWPTMVTRGRRLWWERRRESGVEDMHWGFWLSRKKGMIDYNWLTTNQYWLAGKNMGSLLNKLHRCIKYSFGRVWSCLITRTSYHRPASFRPICDNHQAECKRLLSLKSQESSVIVNSHQWHVVKGRSMMRGQCYSDIWCYRNVYIVFYTFGQIL